MEAHVATVVHPTRVAVQSCLAQRQGMAIQPKIGVQAKTVVEDAGRVATKQHRCSRCPTSDGHREPFPQILFDFPKFRNNHFPNPRITQLRKPIVQRVDQKTASEPD